MMKWDASDVKKFAIPIATRVISHGLSSPNIKFLGTHLRMELLYGENRI